MPLNPICNKAVLRTDDGWRKRHERNRQGKTREYADIIKNVNDYFDNISLNGSGDIGYDEYSDGDPEGGEEPSPVNDPSFVTAYEKIGWRREPLPTAETA